MMTDRMVLPHFIIAGERRSGTTSLTRWLDLHPEIYLHPQLDMGYFIDDSIKGRKDKADLKIDFTAWKQNHSIAEYSNKFSERGNAKVIGEKSADYFFWQPAHSRMQAIVPDAKIIITLRNPIERAWSHYWNEVAKGRELLTFEEAIKQEDNRAAKSDYYKSHLSYIKRGFYDLSYETFLKHFRKENILFVTLDELKSDSEGTMKKIYEFIGVDSTVKMKSEAKQHNKNWVTFQTPFVRNNRVLSTIELFFVKVIRKTLLFFVKDPFKRSQIQLKIESTFRDTMQDQKLDAKLRQELSALFLPHIIRFETMTGKDLSYWKN